MTETSQVTRGTSQARLSSQVCSALRHGCRWKPDSGRVSGARTAHWPRGPALVWPGGDPPAPGAEPGRLWAGLPTAAAMRTHLFTSQDGTPRREEQAGCGEASVPRSPDVAALHEDTRSDASLSDNVALFTGIGSNEYFRW